MNSRLDSPAVPPDGDPTSPMWLLGEAPGAVEERIGKPFIGPAGKQLDMALRDAEVLRSELFIWNIFTRRPPANKVEYYFQDKKCTVPTFEAEEMISALRQMIKLHKPNVIVALGSTALYILTGQIGITKWRGSVLDCTLVPGVKIYPTYHPSYVMRLMQERGEKKEDFAMNVYPTFIHDLRRAQEQSETRSFPVIKRKYILPETVGEIEAYLEWLTNLKEPVSCDIETVGVDGELPIVSRIGFAPSAHEGISIPFLWKNKVCWTIEEWARILVAISRLFLDGPRLIFQNGFFDLTVLGYMFGLRTRVAPYDTMVQQHCAYPHLPKGLAYQASVYTWQPYYKEDRKKHKAGQLADEALSTYNIDDCCVTKEIQPATYQHIRNLGMMEGYERTLSLYPSLLYMMLKGVRIDKNRMAELNTLFHEKAEEWLKTFHKLADDPSINPGSPQQLADLLYNRMGFPTQTKRGSRKITTDKDALNKLEMKTQHPIFKAIKEYRKYRKLTGTYTQVQTTEAGRIHTSYDPTGTVTWRLSSYESHLGVGGNLQNQPKRDKEAKRIRTCFLPDEGKVIVRVDYAQAEDRYVNWKAGDEKGISDYLSGRDPHWENCKLFMHDEVPQDAEWDPHNERFYFLRNNIVKHVNHANNYGEGPKRLQEQFRNSEVYYSLTQCRELLERARRAKPIIEAWKAWVREKIKRDRTLITCFNRKRIFYGRLSDDLYRKAYAFEPQSAVGELMEIGIRNIHDHLWDEGVEVLMNVHDEVVAQVPKNKVEELLPKMREILEVPLHITDVYGTERELVIPVDFEVGPSWGETEEVNL